MLLAGAFDYDIIASDDTSDRYLIRYEIIVQLLESGPYARVGRLRFPIIRETNACFVISDYSKHKYVLKDQSGKRFAYLTDAYTIRSLYSRTKWRKYHARMAMDKAEIAEQEFRKRFLGEHGYIKEEYR